MVSKVKLNAHTTHIRMIPYLILLSLHSTPIQKAVFDGASRISDGWVSEFKEGTTAKRSLWGTADQAKQLVKRDKDGYEATSRNLKG